MPKEGRRGIAELAGTGGGTRSTGNQEILHGMELLGSRPSAAEDEAVRDPGASSWRTLSARLRSLS